MPLPFVSGIPEQESGSSQLLSENACRQDSPSLAVRETPGGRFWGRGPGSAAFASAGFVAVDALAAHPPIARKVSIVTTPGLLPLQRTAVITLLPISAFARERPA
jgi:hypothetical protein